MFPILACVTCKGRVRSLEDKGNPRGNRERVPEQQSTIAAEAWEKIIR